MSVEPCSPWGPGSPWMPCWDLFLLEYLALLGDLLLLGFLALLGDPVDPIRRSSDSHPRYTAELRLRCYGGLTFTTTGLHESVYAEGPMAMELVAADAAKCPMAIASSSTASAMRPMAIALVKTPSQKSQLLRQLNTARS